MCRTCCKFTVIRNLASVASGIMLSFGIIGFVFVLITPYSGKKDGHVSPTARQNVGIICQLHDAVVEGLFGLPGLLSRILPLSNHLNDWIYVGCWSKCFNRCQSKHFIHTPRIWMHFIISRRVILLGKKEIIYLFL